MLFIICEFASAFFPVQKNVAGILYEFCREINFGVISG
jgi:hypothetical protein